jgi:hypothetical protein
MGQDFYWVIGRGTDTGKTTIATALLRSLNRRGYPALGFKPYSAVLLPSLVDAMCEPGSATRGQIAGRDALDLASASPLTGAADVECTVAVQYVCYPSYRSAMIARIGSAAIDERIILRSDHQRQFLDRPDIAALFEAGGIAMSKMAWADHLKLSGCPANSQEQVGKSFRRLAARDGVTAVVCEGIGQFLPLWRGMPTVDHLFYIDMSSVRFFPNIRLDLKVDQYETLYAAKMIDHIVNRNVGLFTPLPIVRTDFRHLVADELVENLLQAQ